jgi:hypothetical protein
MVFFRAITTMNRGRYVIAALMALMLCGMAMAQQETGQISGTVKDASGAVVPGAAVTARSVATSLERTATTNSSGYYVIPNLLPGAFTVTVTMTGFNAAKRQIDVTVGSRISADFALAVGSSATTIEVVGGAVEQVNIESQTLVDTITAKQVETLPTLTRNPYDLVGISGNISPDDAGRGAGYAINGQRSSSTNILLDGSDNNDSFTATPGQAVPLDSVQEFSVVTSSFTAEYGRAGGGVVNVATKSGSNTFHGSAYEFNRVSRLASNGFDNNAYEVPRAVFTRNQFGYSIGGPIVKDKLFFFNNTEWFRIRSMSNSVALVPTPQLIAAANSATQAYFTAYGALKTGISQGRTYTKADISGLCSSSSVYCAALPASTPVWQTVTYPVPADAGGGDPRNEYQTVARVDYNLSPSTTIYGRYALQNQDAFKGVNVNSPYQGFDTGYTTHNQNILLSVVHTFTPKLVSQSKIVFNRLNQTQPLGDQPAEGTLYLAASNTASRILGLRVALPGYTPYAPGNAIPFGGPQNLGQIFEDISWIHGNHNIRFGGSYIYIRDNRMFGAYQSAVEQLGNNLGVGMENFLKGQLLTFQAAVYPQGKYPGETLTLPVGQPDFTRSNRYHDFSFYGQDTWHVAPRVTVNLGMRWEYYGVQHNKYPKKDSNFYLGSGSTLDDQITNGKVMLAPDSPYNGLWDKDLNNVAPRIGIAWDVFGNGKTSLRGGYGISYERNFGNVTFNVIQNPPNYAVISIAPVNVGGNLPVYTLHTGPLGGSTGSKVLPPVTLRAVNEHMKNAYAHSWSVALEHELAHNTFFSLEYSASRGSSLYGINGENRLGSYQAYHQTDVGFSNLNPQYAAINYRTSGGFSRYHAMIAGLTTRNLLDNSLQFSINYTWAHNIDNLSSTFSETSNNFNLGFLDPRHPKLDSGDADFDVRHRVAISGIFNPKFARNMNPVAKVFLDGWNFTPIITLRTGQPYTVWDCTNAYYGCNRMIVVNKKQSLTGPDRPAALSEAPNLYSYIDLTPQLGGTGANAYYNPYSGTDDFGPYPSNMSRRNAFRGPGNWDVTLGLYKNFGFRSERYSLQFRAEFYNLFNHANLYANVGSAEIDSQDYVPAYRDGRRNIQFAMKFLF